MAPDPGVGVPSTPSVQVREKGIDVRQFGAKVDGATDDSAALLAAMQAIPAFAANQGGEKVLIPPGILQVAGAADLSAAWTSGVLLQGAGQMASLIRGAINGTLLGTPANSSYQGLFDLTIVNTDVHIGSLTLNLNQVSGMKWRNFNISGWATGNDSAVVKASGLIIFDADHGLIGGANASPPDWAFLMPGTVASNDVGFHDTSFTGTRSGLKAVNGTVLAMDQGTAFQGFNGQAHTNPGCVSVDAWSGIVLDDLYLEGPSGGNQGIVFYATNGAVRGFHIGPSYFHDIARALNIVNGSYGVVEPQYVNPAADFPNPDAVLVGSTTVGVTIHPQFIASGTGKQVNGTPGAGCLVLNNEHAGIASFYNSLRLVKGSPTYSASITPDASSGPWQTITVTDANALAINAPTNLPSSTQTAELTIEVFNNSGGAMGAITWNAAFAFAGGVWANPATGARRFARFEWNGTKWVLTSLASADY